MPKIGYRTTATRTIFEIYILWTSQMKLLLSYPSQMPAVEMKQWNAAVDMRITKSILWKCTVYQFYWKWATERQTTVSSVHWELLLFKHLHAAFQCDVWWSVHCRMNVLYSVFCMVGADSTLDDFWGVNWIVRNFAEKWKWRIQIEIIILMKLTNGTKNRMIKSGCWIDEIVKTNFRTQFREKWRKVVWFDQYIWEVCMVARKVDNIASWHKPKTVKTCWNSRIYSSHNKTAIHLSIHPLYRKFTQHTQHKYIEGTSHTVSLYLFLSLTHFHIIVRASKNWTSSILAAGWFNGCFSISFWSQQLFGG